MMGRKYKLLGNAVLLSRQRATFSGKNFSPAEYFEMNLHVFCASLCGLSLIICVVFS